jgi:ribosomal protein S27E
MQSLFQACVPYGSGKIGFMELRCENCGELIQPIEDPNPQVTTDEPQTWDVLCPRCRFILATHDGGG